MPFTITSTDFSPLVIDNEYEIINENLLAEYVAELLLGNHIQVTGIINSLRSSPIVNPLASIDHVINMVRTHEIEKRDGWLFQMISWLVLTIENRGAEYYSQPPHSAPAHHGIDGLSITLDTERNVVKIIITEDKCTIHPRKTIKEDVFPEFEDFETGKKDHTLIGILSYLLSNVDAGKVLENVKNDLFDTDLRRYRIGITRENSHNSESGRKRLFKNYELVVSGKDNSRRTGATIHIHDLRNWMENFANIVITYLEAKKP